MSRKSKKNLPPPPSAQPQTQAAPQGSTWSQRNVFIGAAVALILAFLVATLFYRSEKSQTAQLAAAKNQPALASEQSPAFGNPAAKVHIVEFFDPACETCGAFFPHVKKLLAANPDRIRLSLRHVPFHKGSDLVVRILEASRKQDKYLPTLEALLASQAQWAPHHTVQPDLVLQAIAGVGLNVEQLMADMNSPEVAQRMEQDRNDAVALKVTATPEYFVNGRPMPSFGQQQLLTLVSEALQGAY
jgi:protein-disulfide isomerase